MPENVARPSHFVYTNNGKRRHRLLVQTTKSQILAHIKRAGGSTVDQLASTLGLARMTIRQHLATLERDNLLQSRGVKGATGRPHYVFSLSDKGHELFPKRYDRLADMLLQEIAALEGYEIAGLTPFDKKRLILGKVVSRIASEHAPTVAGKPLPERVALVTDILQQEGGFAEWRKGEQGYEIIDYNCVYRKVAEAHDDVCAWHVALLGQLLGDEVRCDQYQSQGSDCCRFVIDGKAVPRERAAKTGEGG